MQGEAIEAVVQAGAQETTYRRAGDGVPPILLLAPAGQEAGEWLFTHLSRRFRTILPALPAEWRAASADPGGEAVQAWLRGLIDGLGLERPSVVATTVHRPLLACVRLEPLRIHRVALVHAAADAASAQVSGGPGTAEAERAGAAHPFLPLPLPAVEHTAGRATALAALIEFLASPVAPAQPVSASLSPS